VRPHYGQALRAFDRGAVPPVPVTRIEAANGITRSHRRGCRTLELTEIAPSMSSVTPSKASACNMPVTSTTTTQIYAAASVGCKLVNNNLEFNGVPEAVRVIKVSGKVAAQLADLVLHATDLSFARDSLDALSATGVSTHTRESLWRSALAHFYKCFASGCRERLNADEIYKSEPIQVMETFTHLQNVRNKHLAHDVNVYAQAFIGAALNKPAASSKIAVIVKGVFLLETLDQQQHKNFQTMLNTTLQWVESKFTVLSNALETEHEATPYAELATRPTLRETTATVGDADRVRPRR
jgi:hypothetical protein